MQTERVATTDGPPARRAGQGESPRRRARDVSRPYRYILPAVVLVGAVFAYPIARGVWTSLHRDVAAVTGTPYVGLENYAELLDSDAFWNALSRSGIFVAGTLTLGMILSLTFALVLHSTPWSPLRRGLRALSLAPWLISGVAVATMFRFLFNSDVGMVRFVSAVPFLDAPTWLGDPNRAVIVVVLANTWYIVPFATLLLLAGLQTIDPDLYGAASIDGASSWQAFRFVTIPSLAPYIALSLVYFSFASWNTFDLVLTMTAGGPARATEVLALYMYRLAFTSLDFSTASAVMVVLLILNILFSVLYLKSFKTDQ